jgi:hypothetical protein
VSKAFTTEAIIEALKSTNGLISLAARRLGCDPVTIYMRAKKVQAVQTIIDQAREELVDLAELSLRRKIVEGEGWAVMATLKTLGKKRGYVEKQEIEVSNTEIVVKKLSGVSYEDL